MHIILFLRSLYWLPISYQAQFKVLVITYKALSWSCSFLATSLPVLHHHKPLIVPGPFAGTICKWAKSVNTCIRASLFWSPDGMTFLVRLGKLPLPWLFANYAKENYSREPCCTGKGSCTIIRKITLVKQNGLWSTQVLLPYTVNMLRDGYKQADRSLSWILVSSWFTTQCWWTTTNFYKFLMLFVVVCREQKAGVHEKQFSSGELQIAQLLDLNGLK